MLAEILKLDQFQTFLLTVSVWTIIAMFVVTTVELYDIHNRKQRAKVIDMIASCHKYHGNDPSRKDKEYYQFVALSCSMMTSNPFYTQWVSNGGFDQLILCNFSLAMKHVPISIYFTLSCKGLT